jgi:hypothetical protein
MLVKTALKSPNCNQPAIYLAAHNLILDALIFNRIVLELCKLILKTSVLPVGYGLPSTAVIQFSGVPMQYFAPSRTSSLPKYERSVSSLLDVPGESSKAPAVTSYGSIS